MEESKNNSKFSKSNKNMNKSQSKSNLNATQKSPKGRTNHLLQSKNHLGSKSPGQGSPKGKTLLKPKKLNLSNLNNNHSKSKETSNRAEFNNTKDTKSTEPNPIPNKAKDRLIFIKNLFTNEALQKYLAAAPNRTSSTYEDVAKYFNSYSRNELEIFALIYLWVTSNISYDTTSFFSGQHADQSPEAVFRTGQGVCAGYADLFTAMCKHNGLRAETVEGHVKGYNYKEGQPISKPNHAWNAINCFNQWYLVDSTWGSGSINEEKKFERKFSYFYFLALPEMMIGTHMPANNKWLLMNRTMTLKQFEQKKKISHANFYNAIYEKGIELLSHPNPNILQNDKTLQVRLGVKSFIPHGELFLGETKINGAVINNYDGNNLLTMDLTFEKNGEYTLWVFSKTQKSDGEFNLLGQLSYHLSVNILMKQKKKDKNSGGNKSVIQGSRAKSYNPGKRGRKGENESLNTSIENINPDSLISPLKPKCFDNSNTFLYEPKNTNIKIGQSVKFKVKVKNASSVAVLDYKQFHYLKKKGDDIWEGTVTIKSSFVTIVSQKSSSLFTEIFEFPNIK
jgi:hypothetical protein